MNLYYNGVNHGWQRYCSAVSLLSLHSIVISLLPVKEFSENATKRTDIVAGPSGPEVISLQKVDSLLCLVNVREAK